MSGVATAVIGGAVVGAGASYLAGKEQSKAIKKSGDAQAAAMMASQEMQLEFLREQRADIAEAVEAGLIDLESGINAAIAEMRPEERLGAIQNYANLLQDPSAVFQRPGVQYQYDKGIEALQAGFSRTAGGGMSGPVLQAAQEYGQNFAAMALDAELSRLEPLMNIETAARSRISNLEADRGRMMANLRLTGATGTAGATGAAAPGIAATITGAGAANAWSKIQRANVGTNVMSDLTNIGVDLANMIAYNPGLFSNFGSRAGAGYNSPPVPAGSGYTPSR